MKLEIFSCTAKRLIVFALLVFPVKGLIAQQSHTLYFMQTLPQSNFLNPAVQIPCKVFVGIPGLSSIHLNYSNTFFSYNDLIIKTPDDSIQFNADHFLSEPGTAQQIFFEAQISLIHFGFLYKNYYFNFSIQDKIDAGIGYPLNWFGLVLKGNLYQHNLDLGGVAVYANYYREWAFGASKIVDEQLTLGAKVKLLFGKANVSTAKSNMRFITSDPIYYLTVTSDVAANLSPFNASLTPQGRLTKFELANKSDIASFLLNRKNKGLAIDLGAIYLLNEKVTLSGSLLDIGFISWNTNPVNLSEKGSFSYEGLKYDPKTNAITNLDSVKTDLKNSFVFSSSSNAYATALNPKLYLGGCYDILPTINTGLMLRNELYHGHLLSSATLSANAWYSKIAAASVSWSYINGSVANLGAGLSLRTPNFGLYAVSDNVYGAFKYKSARLLNLRFGLNLLFGCRSCSEADKTITKKGCAQYRDSEQKKQRFSAWIYKMAKARKERLKGK